jgi:hypothetical protein
MADTRGMVQPEPVDDEWRTEYDDEGRTGDGGRGPTLGRDDDVPLGGWTNDPSSGRRRVDQMNDAKATREQRREQSFEDLCRRPPIETQFEGTRFPAWISPTSVKFTRMGDARITLTVPYQFRDVVLSMVQSQSLILDVDIKRWDAPIDFDNLKTAHDD